MNSLSASGCTDGGGDSSQGLSLGSSTLDASAKLALRGKIESSLHHLFKVPQLVDGLTDYLTEVVSEDDQKALALGF